MSTVNHHVGGHAVVIGASMAGLLAARVLAEVYQRVTIVERDRLPFAGEGRRGVPQGRHVHVLLGGGLRAIEELLPGTRDQMLADGAVSCRALREVRLVISGHELTRHADGADVLLASRPFIEGHVRDRVLALPNVTMQQHCDVLGIQGSSDGDRVTGLRIRGRDAGAEVRLPADLVVSANGRSGQLPAWLEELGYPRPVEDRLDIDLRYASRRLRLGPDALGGDRLIAVGARPGLPRGFFLIQQEDHWILTAFGYGPAHHPPSDEPGHLAFIGSVAPADVVEVISTAESLTEVFTHGIPANVRRRYERLARFPEGLLAIGDAISSFNPLYGQGMSVGALEAIQLRRCLEGGERRLARRFFRAAGEVVDRAWDMAIGGDLALPEIEGHRPLALRLTNAYIERLLGVAEYDRVVAQAFNDVADLLAPPQEVMRPHILWRVLRRSTRRSLGRDPATEVAGVPR